MPIEIERVEMFRASDGSIHETEPEAARAGARAAIRDWATRNLSGGHYHADIIAEAMIDSADELAELLEAARE